MMALCPQIVALVAVPEGKAGGDQRAVDVGSELRQVLQQRRGAGEPRHGLDEAGHLIALHGEGEAHQRGARHDAVAVENDEMLVSAAEATHPILDVSRLARVVLAAAAIVDRDDILEAMAQGAIGALLGGTFALIARIGENKDVEGAGRVHRLQLERDRLDGARYAGRILMVDREQKRGAGRQRRAGRGEIDRIGLLATKQRNETEGGIERAEARSSRRRSSTV